MPGLPEVGQLTYNGFTFTGASEVKVSVLPVRDEANRTVVKHATTLTVKAVITGYGNGSTDTKMEEIRSRLTKQGQALTFINRGFGDDLLVNVPGGVSDVSWGPIPEILEWEPVGSTLACEVVWKVTTHLPPKCSIYGNAPHSSPIMAFNYEASFDINDRGYTTRRISGYIEIAQTRLNGGRTISLSADSYRRKLGTLLPLKFKRSQTWNLSKDKSRLDFSITDREIESRNAFPAGVTEIKARHRVAWGRANRQSMRLRNSLSAEIEVLPTLPITTTWAIFLSILLRRMNAADAVGKYPFLESIEIDEDIFGTSASFAASWRITGGISDFLNTGIFYKDTNDWSLWKTSVASAFNEYGHANLSVLPYDDIIVDLCMERMPESLMSPLKTPPKPQSGSTIIKNKKPSKNLSWLEYKNTIVPKKDMAVSRQALMQAPQNDTATTDPNDSSSVDFPANGSTPDVIQESGAGSYTVWLVGSAQRVGHHIPRPRLLKIGSQTPVEGKVLFSERDLGKHFGEYLYEANWAIEYILPSAPGKVISPTDLAYQEDPPNVS